LAVNKVIVKISRLNFFGPPCKISNAEIHVSPEGFTGRWMDSLLRKAVPVSHCTIGE